MKKIAIRLLVISLLVAVVIVFFLNRILNKPSHLIELVPSSAVAVVHLNTREIAKDVYRFGGFTQDSIKSFNKEFPYFKDVMDPRKIGINVYSELYLFQDKAQEGDYNCLLFNLNNLHNFKNFCSTNSLLAAANGKQDSIYYSSRDSFYVWIRDTEAALLFNVISTNHLDQIMTKISSQKKEEVKPFKKVLEAENNIVIWQSQSNNLMIEEIPFMGEYAEFYGDFKNGKLEYNGKTTQVLEANSTLWDPMFTKTPKAIIGAEFKGEITVENKEIHPLAGVIRKWRNQR